ncbi:MAG: IS66 family transposase [Gammaproteobacteria bacterium]|nr:IS66 family transposase [Gammaproteobacteria bacterium]
MLNSGVSVSGPATPPVLSAEDWERLYVQERARAEAAEARVTELEGELGESEARAEDWRRESVRARSELNGLRRVFESNREKLAAARADLKDLHRRRSTKNVLRLEKEVARLQGLLNAADIDSGRRSITGLRKEISRLKELTAKQAEELEELKAENERLRSARETHAKARFGQKSEKKEKSGSASGRNRGQQADKPGHGRTPRPDMERKPEAHDPPEEERVCPCCGLPYVKNGSHDSEAIEIEVRVHVRIIQRNRWRQSCTCASAPKEVSVPPVPRLFPHTPYGISFWVCFLFECYACHRPLNRVAAWMRDQGLPVSPGTLASSIHRLMPLFAPLSQAILAHLKAAAVLHGDETSWRVQSLKAIRGTGKAWLWCAVSRDAVWFHVDARRNAEAAGKLFAGVGAGTVLVCDAFSAYKKLARLLGGILILAWCWSHVRRKFIEAAAGNDALERWEGRWLDRFGQLFHLNRVRLKHYDPDVGMEEQSRKFGSAHRRLKRAVDRLFALAETERAGPAGSDRRAKALNSLLRHRDGLCVFVDRPDVPMDNNLSERMHRGPVIGRKLSFGSDSLDGALFSATMYGIIETLRMNGIDVRTWLDDWLSACAGNGGQPPEDLSPWLPWSMDEDRRRQLKAAR